MTQSATASSETPDADPDGIEIDAYSCPICLHAFRDRSLVPTCAHEFCFECILEWTEQSRECPLCKQIIGDYLIHRIRGRYDYQKYHIAALQKDADSQPGPSRRTRRERVRREEADRLEQSIEKRRAVYEWHLFAKHVASNAFTKYRPYPTPTQFGASPDLIRRTTMFLRRELRVWPNLDVEFLTTFTISLMKSIDIRSESAVKLIAEFLDFDGGKTNAEHFAHEIYSYVRSPFQDLFVYDTVVQYDDPPERDTRWRGTSLYRRTRSPHDHHSRPPPRRDSQSPRQRGRESSRTDLSWSPSWSPSGRIYHNHRGRSQSPARRPFARSKGKQKERAPLSPALQRSASHVWRQSPPSVPKSPSPTPEAMKGAPRPKRVPRSAMEALHAHLGTTKGNDNVQGPPSPPPLAPLDDTSLTEPVQRLSRQDELKARLQALKSEVGETDVVHEAEAREKKLKLRARLAAEKRKYVGSRGS